MPDGGSDNFPHMRRRAGDVRAAVAALRADARVLTDRIGLVGGSQAGWVIPMAAAKGRAAFTVILSGGTTSVSLETVFSQAAGQDETGPDLPSIDDAIDRTRRHFASDPDVRAELAAMDAPGLWLFGDRDRSNPTQLCVELLESLKTEHAKDFTIQRFPTGNHGLFECRWGGSRELGALRRKVPGLGASIERWLALKGFLDESSEGDASPPGCEACAFGGSRH